MSLTGKLRLAALAIVLGSAGHAQASLLVGVTGDGAVQPETLYYLDKTNASSTFLMSLGNGADGEAIAYNPTDGLLYHASGISDGDRFWESINLNTASIVSSGQFTGPDVVNENLAMTFNFGSGEFLVANRINTVFYSADAAGNATNIGTTPEDLKGLAFVGSILYGVAVFDSTLYELDPSDGSVIDSTAVTLGGLPVTGMNGLATDPDTGELWALFRVGTNPGVRFLGTLDPATGVATSVGVLTDAFAGIAFVAAIPEASVITAWSVASLGAIAAAIGAARRRKALQPETAASLA
jgi:hypothetical protein